jgi:hypothetical protein
MAVAALASNKVTTDFTGYHRQNETKTASAPDLRFPLPIDKSQGLLPWKIDELVSANAVAASLGKKMAYSAFPGFASGAGKLPTGEPTLSWVGDQPSEDEEKWVGCRSQQVPSWAVDRLYEKFRTDRANLCEYNKLVATTSVSRLGEATDISGFWRRSGEAGAHFLIQQLESETRTPVLQGAVAIFQALGEVALPTIVESLRQTSTEGQLEVALRSLQHARFSTAAPYYAIVLSRLRELCNSDKLDIRELAYMASAALRHDDQVDLYREALEREESHEARELLDDLLNEAGQDDDAGA